MHIKPTFYIYKEITSWAAEEIFSCLTKNKCMDPLESETKELRY